MLCSTCRKEIPHDARKCTECNSFQGWRRYVYFSSTVLALMVAVLSVATLFVDKVFPLLQPKESDLEIIITTHDFIAMAPPTNRTGLDANPDYYVLTSDPTFISIVAANNGTKAGYLLNISIILKDQKGSEIAWFVCEFGENGLAVPADSTVPGKCSYLDLGTAKSTGQNFSSCVVNVNFVDQKGWRKLKPRRLRYLCDDGSPL